MCNQPIVAGSTLRRLHERPAPTTAIDVRAVVITAIDTFDEDQGGHTGNLWVQEISAVSAPAAGMTLDPLVPCPLLPDGRHRACSMQLFNSMLTPTGYHPAVGDVVDIAGGEYSEFDCSGVCGNPPQPFSGGHFIPEIGQARVTSSGVAPEIPPLLVTLEQLQNNIQAYVGVLVELQNVTALGAPDCRGEIALSTGTDAIKITQQLVAMPHGEGRVDARPGRVCAGAPTITDPDAIRNGTRWDRLIGIASYFYGPKLMPRSNADLIGQRAP